MSDEPKTRENSPGLEIVSNLGPDTTDDDVIFYRDSNREGNALHQFVETVDRIFAEREAKVWEQAANYCTYDGWDMADVEDTIRGHIETLRKK
jgi:hypothetical protein